MFTVRFYLCQQSLLFFANFFMKFYAPPLHRPMNASAAHKKQAISNNPS